MIPLTAIKGKLRQVLHLGDSPRRTALAFAVGVFIAFSPTYGLHIVTALFCAWAFRLNLVAVMAGNLLNNPWTFVPIVGGSMWVGLLVDPVGPPPNIDWSAFKSLMWIDKFRMLWEHFYPYLTPFVVGHVLLGAIGAGVGYILIHQAILRLREHQARTHRGAPVAPPPPSC